MSAAEGFAQSWCVGPYTATLTCPAPVSGAQSQACVEWEPSKPARLTVDELRQYRAGRDTAIANLSRRFGLRVAILEF